MKDYPIVELPLQKDVETKKVLKLLNEANKHLALLKGISKTIPNQGILINTLPLLEAKDSSAIENIITTHDEIYREGLFSDYISSAEAKEVKNYALALKTGFESIKDSGMLTINTIIAIQATVENNQAGFRKLPGTELKNVQTQETVYVPPQNHEEILRLMTNLERFINQDEDNDLDPLIKMAIIHFQFESIHPFYDGNGRTGRIINILYLVLKNLLDIPVLYLSKYVIRNKSDYYRLLQDVRDEDTWENWILFILQGVLETSQETILLITAIRDLMQEYKMQIRGSFKFYSQELLNNLFSHPYTKIEFLERDLQIHRQTAAKYLNELAEAGLLKRESIGKHNYYINEPLFKLFLNS